MPLDPEDSVVGGRTYCQVLDGEYRTVGLYGDLTSCDFTVEHLDGLDAMANAGLQLTPEEGAMVRAVLNDAIMGTGSNPKAALLTAALRKLPHS